MTRTDRIRAVLAQHGNLAVAVETLDDEANLYAAGLSSHSTVKVMLAIEDAFEIEFPDELLHKSTFTSVASLDSILARLQ